MQVTSEAQGWHVAQWGLWGWAETALKGVGILIGIIAFLGALDADEFVFGGNPHLAGVILFTLMTLFTFVPLTLRYGQREVISMIFAIMNTLGHLGLWFSLVRVTDETTLPIVFGIMFVLGELTKQRFLTLTNYTELGQSASGMLNFSRGVTAIYALFVILMVL